MDGQLDNLLQEQKQQALQLIEEQRKQTALLLKIVENTTDGEKIHRNRKYFGGEKVVVELRTSFIAVGDINDAHQEFSADVYIEARWKEPLLVQKDGSQLDAKDVDWDEHWDPRIVVINEVSTYKKNRMHQLTYEDGDGIPVVILGIRINATFKENLELFDFPLDYQNLTLRLMSDWPNTELEFEKSMTNIDKIRTDNFSARQQWVLKCYVNSQKITYNSSDNHVSWDQSVYPMYESGVQVTRRAGFYFWNVFLVLFCIMLLTFASFTVNRASPNDRLGVTLTLLLTSVAFKFIVTSSLPAVSYLTFLDLFVIGCLVIQFLIAGENAIVALLQADSALTFDIASAAIIGGCTIAFQVIMVFWLFIKIYKRKKILAKNCKKYEELCTQILENRKRKEIQQEELKRRKEELHNQMQVYVSKVQEQQPKRKKRKSRSSRSKSRLENKVANTSAEGAYMDMQFNDNGETVDDPKNHSK
ncbi:gamma-aminobutyric acid receptor subunit pi [Lingula anatina]|uniref:Gamma-aminobutyric acid receptor subunit pi n=1 Tax=Lingula anatina TaxID=7574 RepID=A0A1S3HAV6_LINAN|nr:gamma-aminobutyric acid receptor subunit pi [Lingula anatina]|eukprot:XP_013383172.1 gamma-aminobutyric acid receptor subunit pi [Lingula anatina]